MPHRNSVSRRDFLGRIGAAAAAAGLPAYGGAPRSASASEKPNIVLILADDMGFSDIGCYGSEISTPNIDRLASRGVRFTHFYNSARCCPTRASLLTGLYTHQAGVGWMERDMRIPNYEGRLNDRCVTIAEALRLGGYRTLMSGKWHVGEQQPHWPLDRGFDRYFGLISGASSYWQPTRKVVLGETPYAADETFYMTDATTDHALDFLGEHDRAKDGQPFFLYLAYTAPHYPLHARPEDIARYKGRYMSGWDALRKQRHRRMIEMGIVQRKWPLTPRDAEAPAWADATDKEAWDLKMAVYAAQIECMDRNIGRLLARLHETGAEENTLVMFLSDNGGCAEPVGRIQHIAPGPKESFLAYGLPWANASNTPFRRYKHWVHEGGISTPLIARWPGKIKPGRMTHQPGHVIDVMATCLDAAGAEYPKAHQGKDVIPLEGKSLVPVFEGKQRRGHDAIFWEHEGNRAVRQGKWKLVSQYPGDWELYDLEADRTEMADIAAKHPAQVRELSQRYREWAARAGVAPWDDVRAQMRKMWKI